MREENLRETVIILDLGLRQCVFRNMESNTFGTYDGKQEVPEQTPPQETWVRTQQIWDVFMRYTVMLFK